MYFWGNAQPHGQAENTNWNETLPFCQWGVAGSVTGAGGAFPALSSPGGRGHTALETTKLITALFENGSSGSSLAV